MGFFGRKNTSFFYYFWRSLTPKVVEISCLYLTRATIEVYTTSTVQQKYVVLSDEASYPNVVDIV